MIEMPVVEDSVTVDLVDEALLSYSAAEPVWEPVDPSFVGDGPSTGNVVLGTCYAAADE